MLKHIKNLLKHKILIIAIFVTISITYLSLAKLPKYNANISHIDKWQHSFAYFILAISWLFSFQKKSIKYHIIISCFFFGIIIEILQYTLTNYRTGEYLDIVANTFGILIGLLFFNQFFKK